MADAAGAFLSFEANEHEQIRQWFRVQDLGSEIASALCSVVSGACFRPFIFFPLRFAANESHFGGLCVFHVVILSLLSCT